MNQPSSSFSGTSPTFPAKLRLRRISNSRLGYWLRKLWWVVVLVLVVGGAIIGWYAWQGHQKQTWNKAIDNYRHADYAKAAGLLLTLPLPEQTDDLKIYGQTMLATNHLDKAIIAYQKVVDKNNDPFAQLVLGNIYNQQKQYDKAIKAYNAVIDSHPNYVQAYINEATVYRLQGQNAKAIAVADQGLKNNPNNILLAELEVSLLQADSSSAEYKTAVERLRKINPHDPLLAGK